MTTIHVDGRMVDPAATTPRPWLIAGTATNGRTVTFTVTAPSESAALRLAYGRAILDQMTATEVA